MKRRHRHWLAGFALAALLCAQTAAWLHGLRHTASAGEGLGVAGCSLCLSAAPLLGAIDTPVQALLQSCRLRAPAALPPPAAFVVAFRHPAFRSRAPPASV